MLGVILTIWLLMQLPVAVLLARFIACSQRQCMMERIEQRPRAFHARAA